MCKGSNCTHISFTSNAPTESAILTLLDQVEALELRYCDIIRLEDSQEHVRRVMEYLSSQVLELEEEEAIEVLQARIALLSITISTFLDTYKDNCGLFKNKHIHKANYQNILRHIFSTKDAKEIKQRVKELDKYDKYTYYKNRGINTANDLVDIFNKAGFEPIDFKCIHNEAGKGRCEACQQTYNELADSSTSGILEKETRKINRCGNYIAARVLSTDEAFLLGSKSCGSRFCEYCSFKKSTQRKEDASEWFKVNKKEFQGKHFYHFVFTVRQGKDSSRKGDYSHELIEAFWKLRNSKGSIFSKIWKQAVYGGYYSLEAKVSKDHLNAHIHCLVIANDDLRNTPIKITGRSRGRYGKVVTKEYNFVEEIKKRWLAITSDSHIINIENIYYIDDDGKRVYHNPENGDSEDNQECLDRCIKETLKYTLKADFKDLMDISKELEASNPDREFTEEEKALYVAEFIASIVKPNRRFFGTFGKLNKCGIFSKKEDKDEIELSDRELTSPSTGQKFDVKETSIMVGSMARNFRRVRTKLNDGSYVNHLKVKEFKNLIKCETVGDAVEAFNRLTAKELEGDGFTFQSTRQKKHQAKIELAAEQMGISLEEEKLCYKVYPELHKLEQHVVNGITDLKSGLVGSLSNVHNLTDLEANWLYFRQAGKDTSELDTHSLSSSKIQSIRAIQREIYEEKDKVQKYRFAQNYLRLFKDEETQGSWVDMIEELRHQFPEILKGRQTTKPDIYSPDNHINQNDIPF